MSHSSQQNSQSHCLHANVMSAGVADQISTVQGFSSQFQQQDQTASLVSALILTNTPNSGYTILTLEV